MKKVLSLALTLMMLLGCMAVASAEEVKPVILVVSFGTSYNDNRELTIGAVEADIQAAYPDWEVRRAFTAQTIIEKKGAAGISANPQKASGRNPQKASARK